MLKFSSGPWFFKSLSIFAGFVGLLAFVTWGIPESGCGADPVLDGLSQENVEQLDGNKPVLSAARQDSSCTEGGRDRSFIFQSIPFAPTHTIDANHSISSQFMVPSQGDMDIVALELINIYGAEISSNGSLSIQIHQDSTNAPGEVMGSWSANIDNYLGSLYTIQTTDQCVFLNVGSSYWVSVHAGDASSSVVLYSTMQPHNFALSENQGTTWQPTSSGAAAAMQVAAEYTYVSFLENPWLGESGNTGVDSNLDWALVDINPNSQTDGSAIGPLLSPFTGKIQLWYMGKPT